MCLINNFSCNRPSCSQYAEGSENQCLCPDSMSRLSSVRECAIEQRLLDTSGVLRCSLTWSRVQVSCSHSINSRGKISHFRLSTVCNSSRSALSIPVHNHSPVLPFRSWVFSAPHFALNLRDHPVESSRVYEKSREFW